MAPPPSNDEVVQATNNDATMAKWSAVNAGYWEDPYLQPFVKASLKNDHSGGYGMIRKKGPLINRGYYARMTGMHHLLHQFLARSGPKQVISLGAGFDTTFFRLSTHPSSPLNDTMYVEVDFSAVTMAKSSIIRRTRQLMAIVGSDANMNGVSIHSTKYHLIDADLRDIDHLADQLKQVGIDVSVPTFFMAECVLIYLPPERSRALLRWVASTFKEVAFVNYEQIEPNDRFGQTMMNNLAERGCPLLGLADVPDLSAQKQRYVDAGFDICNTSNDDNEGTNDSGVTRALAMSEVYHRCLSNEDRERLNLLEKMDEWEEWDIMMRHYCISWVSCGLGSSTLEMPSI